MSKFACAERFKAPQGEGLFTGQQMAFIRLVGCSVGKGICTACDTDFDKMLPELGGGLFSVEELQAWAAPCEHICLTGGEPLDRDIRPLLFGLTTGSTMVHIETSGTRRPLWLDPFAHKHRATSGRHMVAFDEANGGVSWREIPLWITVSPKPGYNTDMVNAIADELKVILGGLGDGPGWPSLHNAICWAEDGLSVYVQPRNETITINRAHLDEALDVVAAHPKLKLSCQLHKFLKTR